MNTLIKIFGIFVAIPLLISGCGPSIQVEKEEPAIPNVSNYELVLGKALTDEVVADFIVKHQCSRADQFYLCKEIGMAMWVNSTQAVEIIYLYLNNDEGFNAYKGELPFGLKFYDTLGAVEYKLKRQDVGNAGLPDEGAVPDHMHYRAIYHQAGMTIIYNSPFQDEDATIYAILVSQ